jgi:undecaprenyl-diphosphatase
MDASDALILGLIEGLTEFLPVSSTGHLLLTERLLGIERSPAHDAYAIVIQGGAILAVLALYRDSLARAARGAFGGDAGGRGLVLAILAAFAPAALLGLAFGERIQSELFGLRPVAAAWIAGGLPLVLFARRLRAGSGLGLDALDVRRAFVLGLLQSLALWPGISRSLVTIVGGVLVGLELAAAVEFSFLIGFVTLGAASAWSAWHGGAELLAEVGWRVAITGLAAAFLSAWLAVRGMVVWLRTRSLALFGWYRIALGAAVLVALALGWS